MANNHNNNKKKRKTTEKGEASGRLKQNIDCKSVCACVCV